MIENLKRWLAGVLCPEMARNANQYFRLYGQITTVYRWCDGEAADVAQWLVEGDTNHWRSLDEKPIGVLPSDIQAFREYLRNRRVKAA